MRQTVITPGMFAACARQGRRKLLPLAVVAALLLSGCVIDDSSGKKVVRFCFWGNFSDLALWKTITANFERANPDIKIKLEYITGDYGRKLPLVMISNTAADIILMDDETYPGYAARGYLEDLKPYIERDRAELGLEDFLPTSLESFNFRGFQCGLPWAGGAVMVYYNKDLFDAAGIPYPTDQWTWNDFRAIAKKLTRDLDGDNRIDQYGTNMVIGSILGVQPVIWSFGAEVLNEDRTKFVMNSPKAVEAIQFMYDMKWKDHSIAWAGEGDDIATEVQLLTGRVAMVLAGTFMMLSLKAVEDGMRWGLAEMPYGPYGDRYTRVTWDGISINAKTPYKEEAWRFIKFLLSEESQIVVAKSGRNLPVRGSTARQYFVPPDSIVGEEKVIEATRYGKLTPITAKYLELNQVTQPFFDKLNLGKMSPKDALDAMEPLVNEVLSKELAKWGKEKKR